MVEVRRLILVVIVKIQRMKFVSLAACIELIAFELKI